MSDPDRDSRLDDAYGRAPRDEPPPALDASIRAAARRAVGAKPEAAGQAVHRQRSWTTRWRVPLSLAATVVLAVMLTTLMQEEEGRKARLDAPVASPGTAVPPAAPAGTRAKDDAAPAPSPAAPPAALESRAERQAGRRPEEAKPEAARNVAPAPPAQMMEAPARVQAPAARTDSDLAAREAVDAVAKRAAPEPAPAAAPPPPAGRPVQTESAGAPVRQRADRESAFADRAGRLSRDEMTDARARTPEAWIEDIRRLKAQGRVEEVRAQLEQFRRRHPDFKLPDDLLP